MVQFPPTCSKHINAASFKNTRKDLSPQNTSLEEEPRRYSLAVNNGGKLQRGREHI